MKFIHVIIPGISTLTYFDPVETRQLIKDITLCWESLDVQVSLNTGWRYTIRPTYLPQQSAVYIPVSPPVMIFWFHSFNVLIFEGAKYLKFSASSGSVLFRLWFPKWCCYSSSAPTITVIALVPALASGQMDRAHAPTITVIAFGARCWQMVKWIEHMPQLLQWFP